MPRSRASNPGNRASGPDAAARRLIDVFGRACLAENLLTSDWQLFEPGLQLLYSLCSDYDSTDKLLTVKDTHAAFSKTFSSFVGFDDDRVERMLQTCMRRIMLLGGLHSKVYNRLIKQSTISEDTYAFLYLLGVILDYPTEIHFMTGMPDRPLPQHDYKTLGPLYWHPKAIALACRALNSARDERSWEAAAKYVTSIIVPPQLLGTIFVAKPETWTEAAVGRKQFDAILTDQPCMSTIWDLLRSKHPETMALGVHLMYALVKEPLPTMPLWDHHPHAMANLLSMGGSEPITQAMQAALSRLSQFQKEGRSILPPPQKSFGDLRGLYAPKAVLGQLLIWVDHAATLDWYIRISRGKSDREFLCPFMWNEAGYELPAWPPGLLEAHVLCSMKGLQLEIEQPRLGPTGTQDFSIYSYAWLPGVASVLSRHVWTLDVLVHHTQLIVDSLSLTSWDAKYMRACRMVLLFVRRMLEVQGSHNLKQQLPSMRLIKCCTSAFSRCCEQLSKQRRSGRTIDVVEQKLVISILHEDLLLLKVILDLPVGQEALAAKAAPGTLQTIMHAKEIAKQMGQPEPKVSDATRTRIEARGSPAQRNASAGLNNNSSRINSSDSKSVSGMQAQLSDGAGSMGAEKSSGSSAMSSSAAGPSSTVSDSKSTSDRSAASQGEGSSGRQEKKGPSDASSPGACRSSSLHEASASGPGKGVSSGSKEGGKEGTWVESSGGKAMNGVPANNAEQRPSRGASISMSEGVARLATEAKEGGAGDGGAGKVSRGPERTCGTCGEKGKMRVCGRCKGASPGAFFCSAACQQVAWPTHKQVCKPK